MAELMTRGRAGARHMTLRGRHVWIWALVASLALWLLACALGGHLSLRLLLVNATLASFLAMAGIAQMMVIASGDGSFDMSLPNTITLSALLSAGVFGHQGQGVAIGIPLALVCGVLIGVVNGVLTSALRMPAMVASLAGGYAVYSVILLLQSRHVTGVSTGLSHFLRLQWDGAGVMLLITVAVAAIAALVLRRSTYGWFLHAMGQSRRAARLSGIRVPRMVTYTFMISGFLGAGVGILLAAYDGGAFANIGDVYLLGSVAAVVVGGVPVSGGRSSVMATLMGALVMTLLITVLEVSRLAPGIQDILEGVAVIAIVVFTQLGRGTTRT